MRSQPTSTIAALGIALAMASPAWAADPGGDALKADIDGFLARIATMTNGVVSWDGSDPYQVRQDGDTAVAEIDHARLSVHAPDVAQIAFDHLKIVRSVDKDGGGKLIDYAWTFPQVATLTEADGTQTKLTIKDGSGKSIVELPSGRARETDAQFASARVDHAQSGSWVSFGPFSLSAKVAPGAGSAWTAPFAIKLSKIEYQFPKISASGAIDAITYGGKSAGPDLAKIQSARDAIDAINKDKSATPEARLAAILDLLPSLPSLVSLVQGEVALEGLTVKVGEGGAPMVALAKASFGTEIVGLDTPKAKLRISVHQDGLQVAPVLLDPAKIPEHIAVDVGLEDIDTAALHTILVAAGKMHDSTNPQEKQAANQQMLGAATSMAPEIHIYDATADTKEVGLAATGQTKGSPFGLNGYTVAVDVLVRGFDAIPALAAGVPLVEYLPLLKELGSPAKKADGTPQVEFRLASAPQKWLTINGNDVSAWIIPVTAPGQPRLLRPTLPPMQGNDVKSVQHALGAANDTVEQDGVYGPPTAVAVARYQKANGLNVSGVVDMATRQKLGVKGEMAPTGDGGPPHHR